MVNVVWALAKTDYAGNGNRRSRTLLDLIAKSAMSQMEAFTPEQLSRLLWAFSTLHHYHEALYQAIAAETMQQVGTASRLQNCSRSALLYLTKMVKEGQQAKCCFWTTMQLKQRSRQGNASCQCSSCQTSLQSSILRDTKIGQPLYMLVKSVVLHMLLAQQAVLLL